MCGVVALYGQESQVSQESLVAATRVLSHRGPDGCRTWLAQDKRIGLGHTRLRIIDLETGDQPIENETGDLRLVVNGEFYGYKAIRQELADLGHRFRTASDSEIALHLYEEHELDFLARLRGEFALVLWDRPRHRLIAARDRFGIKPLYYAVSGGVLRLASEVKAIFASGHPPAWDLESCYDHLMLIMKLDRSLFAGVRQVPPGHFMVASRSGVKVQPYWDLDYPRAGEVDESADEEELIEEVRSALEDAVRTRLVADVPVGCYLSGGLDSSVVFGVASAHSPQPLDAFTVSFDREAYDEAPVARETAARWNAPFHHVPLAQADLADHVADTIWHVETIGGNANAVARYLQARATRDAGYRVVLSGDGGDELFAGYADFRVELLAHSAADDARRAELLDELRRATPNDTINVLAPGYVARSIPSVDSVLGFTPVWMHGTHSNRAPFRQLLAPGFVSRFADYDVYGEFLAQYDVEGQLAGRDPVFQSMYLLIRSVIPNQVLFADRLDMASAVEVRTPLFDHHLFDVARRLPLSLLIRGLREKHALREAGKSYLTDSVYARGKQPFLAPQSTLDPSDRLQAMVQDTIRSDRFRDVPFFEQRTMVGLLDMLPNLGEEQRIAVDIVLLLAASACVAHERFMRAP